MNDVAAPADPAEAFATAASPSLRSATANAMLELAERRAIARFWYQAGAAGSVAYERSARGIDEIGVVVADPIEIRTLSHAFPKTISPATALVAIWDRDRGVAAFGSAAAVRTAQALAHSRAEAGMIYDSLVQNLVPNYHRPISVARYSSLRGDGAGSYIDHLRMLCSSPPPAPRDHGRAEIPVVTVEIDEIHSSEYKVVRARSRVEGMRWMRALHETLAPLDPFC